MVRYFLADPMSALVHYLHWGIYCCRAAIGGCVEIASLAVMTHIDAGCESQRLINNCPAHIARK